MSNLPKRPGLSIKIVPEWFGEGAGSVIIEELSQAQVRGATIYGEVLAASSSAVAKRNLVAQRDMAMTNVMQSVLKFANVKPEDVGHIHAHGLSTRTGDIEEARAINNVFGGRPSLVPVTAAKAISAIRRRQRHRRTNRQPAGHASQSSVPHSQLPNARPTVPMSPVTNGAPTGANLHQPQRHPARPSQRPPNSAIRRVET